MFDSEGRLPSRGIPPRDIGLYLVPTPGLIGKWRLPASPVVNDRLIVISPIIIIIVIAAGTNQVPMLAGSGGTDRCIGRAVFTFEKPGIAVINRDGCAYEPVQEWDG